MLISVGSGLHSQAWKKTSTVAAILLSMTASLGKSAASGAGRDSAWKGGRGLCWQEGAQPQAQCLGIWIRFRGPVVKLAFTRGRLVEWNCVAPNVIQLPR
jgi:hypothetical protein